MYLDLENYKYLMRMPQTWTSPRCSDSYNWHVPCREHGSSAYACCKKYWLLRDMKLLNQGRSRTSPKWILSPCTWPVTWKAKENSSWMDDCTPTWPHKEEHLMLISDRLKLLSYIPCRLVLSIVYDSYISLNV